MGLLAYLDKWIIERGSASILRERIALFEQEHRVAVQNLKTQFEDRIHNLEVERDSLIKQNAAIAGERDAARSELLKAHERVKSFEQDVDYWQREEERRSGESDNNYPPGANPGW